MTYRDDTTEGRLLAGDLKAIGQVVRWIAVVVASPRFLSLRSEWVDLHQEVMTRVIESLRQGRFDPGQDLRVYVQAVARYTAMEAMQRRLARGLESLSDQEPQDRPSMTLEEEVASRELARLALDRASEPCRTLITAYYMEHLSYAEIAARMGIPVGTVKSRLVRCLRSIHEAMTDGSTAAGRGGVAREARARGRRPEEIS